MHAMKPKYARLSAITFFAAAMMVMAGVGWRTQRKNEGISLTSPVHSRLKVGGSARAQNIGSRAGAALAENGSAGNATTRVGAELMQILRLKLKQWRETETGADGVQGRLVEEWLALLDDATVGEVVLALSED